MKILELKNMVAKLKARVKCKDQTQLKINESEGRLEKNIYRLRRKNFKIQKQNSYKNMENNLTEYI